MSAASSARASSSPSSRAIDARRAYDEAAYEQALADASRTSCAARLEAGIDVIDDGEMGKPNWITYLYERVSGIDRSSPLEGGGRLTR